MTLTTISDVRAIAGIEADVIDDTTLQSIINQAEHLIKNWTNKTFVDTANGETPPSATEYFDGGVDKIFVNNQPIINVTSLKINGEQKTENEDYYVYHNVGMIKFSDTVDSGEKIIEITYTYGYTSDTPEFKIASHAATLLAASLAYGSLARGKEKAMMFYEMALKAIERLKSQVYVRVA
ncbi:hypothetical protein DRJ17_04500 [Candidatus Woesearchaeota archaeon]|nr:MAG: hypothetical protein DRJ17_04500 [Candidatus Woesearchaeota archaeon]